MSRIWDETETEKIINKVYRAQDAFRRRWSIHALDRVDAELAQKIRRQEQRWHTACIAGSSKDVATHGESMVKGWRKAAAVMESHDAEHDAYMVGVDPMTGVTVTIGDFKPSLEAFKETPNGTPRAIHMTPDEVATMMAGLQLVTQVKKLGAEIVGVRHGEKAES